MALTKLNATDFAGNLPTAYNGLVDAVEELQDQPPPAQGDPGPKGDTGDPGKSAYEVAVDEGFSGSEEAWLASLVGEPGAKGDPGDAGPGLPPGGTTGQIAAKASGTDYDVVWTDPAAAGGDVTSVNGQTGVVSLDAEDVGARADDWVPTWSQVTSKPTTFAPTTHGNAAHSEAFITAAGAPVQSVNGQTGSVSLDAEDVDARPDDWVPTWAQVTGKPTTFTPASHSHSTGDVTGLSAALAGKQDAGNYVQSTTATHIVVLTQSAYNALSPPNATTLYVVVG